MHHLCWPSRSLAVVVLALVCALLVPATAQASGVVSTTGTTTTSVRLSSTTALTGLSVSDTASGDTLEVTLSTDLGTVALGTTTGLTLDYGYGSFSGASISFTGSPADVNTAVGTATLTTTGASGIANVSLSSMVSASGYVYSPTNGHFYTFVSSSNISWAAAQTAAAGLSFKGQTGYLATMPTAATNDVVANRIPGATNAWIAAKSTDTPSATIKRTWKWDDGPVAGQVISYCSNFTGTCDFTNNTGLFSSWDTGSGEPNNYGASTSAYSGEWVAVTNWNGTHGSWNDFPGTSNSVSGYVVEFGDRVNGSSGFSGVSTSTSSVRVESAPDGPTGATAVRGDQSAQVTFTAPSANGSPITGYTATSSPGGLTGTCASSPCTVTGLTNGTAYTFTVTATNAVGTSVASTASAAVTPAGIPGAPTNVSAARGDQQAVVTFASPSDNGAAVTGYTLTASTGGVRTTSSCSASPCTVTGLTNGTAYVFTVRSINAVGTSLASDPSDAVTPAGVPAAPTGASAARGNQSAQVSFTPGSDNGSPITGYTVTSIPDTLTGTCTTSPCTVPGLTNGTAYMFTVTATNAVGSSAASAASAAVTPAAVPDAPTAVSATRGDQQAVVSFTAPSGNGAVITGYTVTASSGGSRTTSSCSASPCTVTGLTNGSASVFTVKATNAVGTSSASDPSDAVTPAGVPVAPTGVSAARADQSAQVSFTAPSGNGSSVTGYTATSSPGGVIGTCSASPCTVSGLTNGTAYTFRVTATNAVGSSAASAASAAVTPAAVPDAPTAVSATRGDQQAVVSFTVPASNGTGISGYLVTASTGGVGTASSCSASPCTVTGLLNGTAYVFTVRATNAVGTSPASDPSDAVTPAGVPTPPTGVTAVRGDQSVLVSFTAPPTGNGSPITVYTTISSPDGLTGTCVSSPCTVSGLTNGTAYTFTVTATNALGASAASAASAPVTPATVPTTPTSLLVEPGDAVITVSFGPPASSGGLAITGYQYSVDGGQTWSSLSTTGTTTLVATLTGLANGTAYQVRVRALTSVDQGAAAIAASVTPARAPGPVTSPVAVATGTAAVVTWTAPVDDGGAPVVSYVVTSTPASTTCSSATEQCTVTGLTPGTAYVFHISADNAHSGQGATGPGPQVDSNVVLVPDAPVTVSTSPVSPTAPGAPGALTVTAGDRSLGLSFTSPRGEAMATVTGYLVSLDAGRTWDPLVTSGADPVSATVAPVLNGHSYAVQVRASSGVGTGAPTATASVSTDQWFTDPLSKRVRSTEANVPKQPQFYRGPTLDTVATSRAANGRAVTSWSAVRGHRLQAGQGVQIRANRLFKDDSSRLTPAGRSRLAVLAQSLVWVDGLTCEGYTDYDLTPSFAMKLSATRARAVCAALAARAVAATMATKGYGGSRPQVIGTLPRLRRANNRIVLFATSG